MKKGVFLAAILANAVALFCTFNPWLEFPGRSNRRCGG